MKSALPRVIVAALAAAIATGAMAAAPQTAAAQQTAAHTPPAVTSPAADNTRLNKRDRNDNAPTSGAQSNAKADIKLAAAVRKAIVHDSSLSVKAHNVKVITTGGGMVLLRGPVNGAQEKTRVGQVVQGVAGVTQVDNQLDIDTPTH